MTDFDNFNLKDFKIENIPNSGFYVRDFISEKEEQELLNKVFIYIYLFIFFVNEETKKRLIN